MVYADVYIQNLDGRDLWYIPNKIQISSWLYCMNQIFFFFFFWGGGEICITCAPATIGLTMCPAEGRERTHVVLPCACVEVLTPTLTYRPFIICMFNLSKFHSNFLCKILSSNISCNFIYNAHRSLNYVFFFSFMPFWRGQAKRSHCHFFILLRARVYVLLPGTRLTSTPIPYREKTHLPFTL